MKKPAKQQDYFVFSIVMADFSILPCFSHSVRNTPNDSVFPCRRDLPVSMHSGRRDLPVSISYSPSFASAHSNDRGGNPLGCASGIRGPPRYDKK